MLDESDRLGEKGSLARPPAHSTPAAPSRGAWYLFASVAVVDAGGVVLTALNRAAKGAFPIDLIMVAYFSFPLVGALVASRRRRNPVGWVLLAIGLVWAVYTLLDGYARYALLTRPGSLPRPDVVLALNSWTWVPAVGLMGTFLILLFPTGRLPSPRWRPVAWMSAIAMAVLSLTSLLWPGPFANAGFPDVNNPVGAEGLAPLLEVVDIAGLVLLVASMAASAASAIHRFRRSRGVERLQMKWLVVGASLAAAVYLANIAVWGYFALSDPGGARPGWAFALEQVMSVSFAAIPIAVGIAIFRYRLYDIDLIINRALVYSTLTAVLALAYAGGVLGLGTVVRSLSGESSNSVAVAASTLLVAALFRPARRRIQAFIDRRFYRRKYDAARTIEGFSERLRDEVDLDQLTSDLVATVGDVMQPTHVSLRLTAAGGPAAVGSPAP